MGWWVTLYEVNKMLHETYRLYAIVSDSESNSGSDGDWERVLIQTEVGLGSYLNIVLLPPEEEDKKLA